MQEHKRHRYKAICNRPQNYTKGITSIIEKHTPITRRQLTYRKHKTWYDENELKLKIQRKES